MRLRGTCLAVLSAALLLSALGTSGANVLSYDVAYWYLDDTGHHATIFNPDTQWLAQYSGSVLVKVQQTVFDEYQTVQMLRSNNDPVFTDEGKQTLIYNSAFLFSYVVTNVRWVDAASTGGITAFGVKWGVAPLYVTTNHSQTSPSWTPIETATAGGTAFGPVWRWDPPAEQAGIKIGSSAGGFWALSPTGADGIVDAGVLSGDPDNPWLEVFGQTTGPVPEPAGLLAVVFGAVALGMRLAYRRNHR